ncbi:amidohydrolase [Mycoplana sp. BE70]|uniref:amidohydrolase n=1 Tax=Mycoplana sp. BE70 TaxID=2817775 RepID=UPI0028629216|nr:amidohydrolase [Mycoplana sp. BE70]MDR6759203.1 amidohydrolase [Mycoplana sp. BE70]
MNIELSSLTNADFVELTAWRRNLHRHPELSGEEERTAATVAAMLRETGPDRIVTGIGGHGVAAIYDSGKPGPRVLLRCELDGLPIEDLADIPHRSTVPGKGHQCGHDGHMAMIAAMARLLGRKHPEKGAVILMFQPAEEDGSGARKVVEDAAFAELKPDFAFAIHNMPGLPFGEVHIVDGPVCCASRGIMLKLTGRTAHASQPETGISPMPAIARLMPELSATSSPVGTSTSDPDFTLVTITHVDMGAPAFGVAPGAANLFATLRSLTDEGMAALVEKVEELALEVAQENGLQLEIGYTDVFVTCRNDAGATSIVRDALDRIGIIHGPGTLPLRGSEDFGYFGRGAKMALMMLGSGEDLPALHNPDFDFPDDLIPIGARIYAAILDAIQTESLGAT